MTTLPDPSPFEHLPRLSVTVRVDEIFYQFTEISPAPTKRERAIIRALLNDAIERIDAEGDL